MRQSGVPREQQQAWLNSLTRARGEDLMTTMDFAKRFRRAKWAVDSPWFHGVWYAAMDDDALKRVFIMGPRFHAKCLRGDALVLMASGERRRIDSLRPGERVIGWLGDHFGPTLVMGVQPNGVQPTLRLTTRRGRSIVANAEHKFLAWRRVEGGVADLRRAGDTRGWVRLEDLRPGDRIASPRAYDITEGKDLPKAEVRTAAYLIGDGDCFAASFVNTDPSLLFEFDGDARSLGFRTRWHQPALKAGHKEVVGIHLQNPDRRIGRERKGAVRRWMEAWQIYGKRSGDKIVPDRIFTASRASQRLFLNRLFATDGCATVPAGRQGSISYTSKSRVLVDDIAHLLLRFGINAKVVRMPNARLQRDYWKLDIGSHEGVTRFLAEIGPIYGREEACARVATSWAQGTGGGRQSDRIPREWQGLTQHGPKWHRLRGTRWSGADDASTRAKVEAIALAEDNDDLLSVARNDIEWAEVISIEPEGDAEVWDIETEAHTFVANDVLTHNSTCLLTFVLRRICENHHIRIGILSQTDQLAKYFLAEVKHELESNDALRAGYFQATNGEVKGDKWTEHNIVLADARTGDGGISGKDVTLFSVSRGAQITGYHCDILIVDDLESSDSTNSDTVRQATREWWAREVTPVVVPGGRILATGTRKHFDDIYSYWLKSPGWHVVDVVKSVYDDRGFPVWPDMWDDAALIAKKAEMDAQDLLAWPQEFLNEPRPSETQMLYPDRWPKRKRGDVPRGMSIVQMWDLAISEKTTADFTVGWTIGIDDRSNVYLLENRRGHWDFNRTLSEIANMGREWTSGENMAFGQLAAIGIEQVAYQAAAVQEAARRTMLPIVPVTYDGRDKQDKVMRARLLEARAALGKVIVVVDQDEVSGMTVDPPWWIAFASEALYFPAGAHDDQVDALSSAVKLAGWQADSTRWAYNVFQCLHCQHMYVFEPNRPCPKCGTRAPAIYENPEELSLGGMGSVSSSGGNAS